MTRVAVDESIGVWSNREMCLANEKVRVKEAPIEVIDRRAVIRSMDFRPMEFRSTRVCHGVWFHCANALSHKGAKSVVGVGGEA